MGKDRKRSVESRQLYDCEWDLEKRCRCRCGGVFHGAKRLVNIFRLSLSDPHQPDRQGKLDLGGKDVSRTYGAP